MNATHMPSVDHHGAHTRKRMHLRPMLPIPVNYATAAIPTFAPYGTEYTPDHTIKIVGGRRISIPNSIAAIPKHPIESPTKNHDPDLAPTRALQNVQAYDHSRLPQPSNTKFDTTYRTEYINRIRHPEYTPWYQQNIPDPRRDTQRMTKSSFNQYFVLPPIALNTTTNTTNGRNAGSARSAVTDIPPSIKNSEIPNNETKPKDVPPLNLNNGTQNFYDRPQQHPPPPPIMMNVDTYLPEEPVLLTDYEEERLCEQIRNQIGSLITVERLKLFYQELTAYDPNVTSYVHYSNIQLVASQLGLNLQEDTLRFAMCKFVSPDRGRGYVNYEDLVRYFGKCLSSISPNQYGPSKSYDSSVYHYPNSHGYHQYGCRCRHQQNPYFNHPCPIHHYNP